MTQHCLCCEMKMNPLLRQMIITQQICFVVCTRSKTVINIYISVKNVCNRRCGQSLMVGSPPPPSSSCSRSSVEKSMNCLSSPSRGGVGCECVCSADATGGVDRAVCESDCVWCDIGFVAVLLSLGFTKPRSRCRCGSHSCSRSMCPCPCAVLGRPNACA